MSKPDLQELLQQALQHHSAGDLRQAEQHYRHILSADPEHPDALHYLGVIGLQAGRFEDAALLIGRAIEYQPEYLDALANLGNAMQALGRYTEAITQYRQALKLQPDAATIIANLGNALSQSGQASEAIENYESALAIDPGLTDARRSLADALLAEGRPSEALHHILGAASREPHALGIQVSMGNILQELGRSDEAIACFEKVLAREPGFAPMYCNIGNVLRQQGRLTKAIEKYEKALSLDSTYVEAHYDLGVAFRDLGKMDDAMTAFRRALTLDGKCSKAWRAITDLSKNALTEKDIEVIQEALKADEHTAEQKMDLEFALGKAREDQGDYSTAIEHYHKGNSLRRASIDYSIDRDREVFENLKSTFDSAFFDRWSDTGVADATPIFIVGMPRSGTTLAEQILASHASVFGGGELLLLPRAISERFTMPDGVDYTSALQAAQESDFKYVADRYIAAIRKIDAESRHVTDKLPTNFLNIGFIKIAFPKARIIHCIRDSRDTCLSIYKHVFSARGHHYSYDMEELGRYYNEYASLMKHWGDMLPNQLYELRYESMVQDQEGTTRALLDACGLPWDAACMEFHKTARPVATISASQVRQPIYAKSVSAWRNYEKSLSPLLRVLDS